jgi:hypothetical protein
MLLALLRELLVLIPRSLPPEEVEHTRCSNRGCNSTTSRCRNTFSLLRKKERLMKLALVVICDAGAYVRGSELYENWTVREAEWGASEGTFCQLLSYQRWSSGA